MGLSLTYHTDQLHASAWPWNRLKDGLENEGSNPKWRSLLLTHQTGEKTEILLFNSSSCNLVDLVECAPDPNDASKVKIQI